MQRLRVISRALSDKASYIKVVRSIIKHIDNSQHKRLFSVRFLAFDHAPYLDVQECIELLDYSILHTGATGIFTKLPAAKDISPEQLCTLMQLCLRDRRPITPGGSPYRDYDEDNSGQCSSCGHRWDDRPRSSQSAVCDLAMLPAAGDLSMQQLAELVQMCIRREEGPKRRALSALLTLPTAQHCDASIAQELLSIAFERGCDDAVDMLCQQLPECAAASEGLDPQLLLQRMEVLLRSTGPGSYIGSHTIRGFLEHPGLQQQTKQILPQLLLSAFAKHCSSRQSSLAGSDRTDKLKMLLQLPAAETLSAAVLLQLMQHSIVEMDGDLLPLLVRLPAAAQLQQGDVAVLLQVAVGRPSGESSSSTDIAEMPSGSAGMAMGVKAARSEFEGQQGTPPQQQAGLVESRTQQQQHQAHGPEEEEQQHASEGSPVTRTSLHELLLECLQSSAAAAHMFHLLTLPWVRQLPAATLKTLLVAAGEYQCKALFQWLLQQPQAPRDDAEVQDFVGLFRSSTGSLKAYPCCYSPPAQSPMSHWRLDHDTPEAAASESYDEMGVSVKKKKKKAKGEPRGGYLRGDCEYDPYDDRSESPVGGAGYGGGYDDRSRSSSRSGSGSSSRSSSRSSNRSRSRSRSRSPSPKRRGRSLSPGFSDRFPPVYEGLGADVDRSRSVSGDDEGVDPHVDRSRLVSGGQGRYYDDDGDEFLDYESDS
jgi:hypothetical protein